MYLEGREWIHPIAKTVATIMVRQPHNNSIIIQTLLLTPEHQRIAALFEPEFWERGIPVTKSGNVIID
jgi:hypothetical protein